MTATQVDVQVDGVLFDIDDTLIDTKAAFAAGLALVAGEFLPDLDEDRYPEMLAVWRADVNDHYGAFVRGEVAYSAHRHARANELQAVFGGLELDDAAFARWDATYEVGFSGAWAAHDDVHEVLDRLRSAGVVVGALSNATVAYQSSKLARTGLDARVPMLVGVDTLGVGKPDPRVFTEACRRLGTAPERTVYVGDELDVDAGAARAAGLVGVWLDRPGPRRQEIPQHRIESADVLVVRSLSDLLAVLGL